MMDEIDDRILHYADDIIILQDNLLALQTMILEMNIIEAFYLIRQIESNDELKSV